MTNFEHTHLSAAELRAIEQRAHEMRAKVMRNGLHAIATFVKSRVRMVTFYLSQREHA